MNIKKMMNKGQGAMEYLMTYGWAILVVMIVGVVLWQLGIFNPPTTTVVKGWVVLQPLSPSISYKSVDQSFTASFNNAVGTSIRVTDVNITEVLSKTGGTNCASVTVDGQPVSEGAPKTVAAGSAFRVDATCSGAGRQRGDPYEMTITITYTSVIGGIVTPHTEVGTIRGTVE